MVDDEALHHLAVTLWAALSDLVGFKNRVLVMFHWGWSWLTFKRGARLITGAVGPLPEVKTIGSDGAIILPPPATSVMLDRDAS